MWRKLALFSALALAAAVQAQRNVNLTTADSYEVYDQLNEDDEPLQYRLLGRENEITTVIFDPPIRGTPVNAAVRPYELEQSIPLSLFSGFRVTGNSLVLLLSTSSRDDVTLSTTMRVTSREPLTSIVEEVRAGTPMSISTAGNDTLLVYSPGPDDTYLTGSCHGPARVTVYRTTERMSAQRLDDIADCSDGGTLHTWIMRGADSSPYNVFIEVTPLSTAGAQSVLQLNLTRHLPDYPDSPLLPVPSTHAMLSYRNFVRLNISRPVLVSYYSDASVTWSASHRRPLANGGDISTWYQDAEIKGLYEQVVLPPGDWYVSPSGSEVKNGVLAVAYYAQLRTLPFTPTYESVTEDNLDFMQVNSDRPIIATIWPSSGYGYLYASHTHPSSEPSSWESWRNAAKHVSKLSGANTLVLPAGNWFIAVLSADREPMTASLTVEDLALQLTLPATRTYELVPSGTTRFVHINSDTPSIVAISPGAGDPDLYASHAAPSANETTWPSWHRNAELSTLLTGAGELELPAGDWYVGVYAYSAFSAVLTVNGEDGVFTVPTTRREIGSGLLLRWEAGKAVILQGTNGESYSRSLRVTRAGSTLTADENNVIILPPLGINRAELSWSSGFGSVRTAYFHPATPAGGLGSAGSLSLGRSAMHTMLMGDFDRVFLWESGATMSLHCADHVPARPFLTQSYPTEEYRERNLISVSISGMPKAVCLVTCENTDDEEQQSCEYHIWTNSTESPIAFQAKQPSRRNNSAAIIGSSSAAVVVLLIVAVVFYKKRTAATARSVELREQLL